MLFLSVYLNSLLRQSIFLLCLKDSYVQSDKVFLKTRLNIFMCFLHNTYSLIFMQKDLTHFTIKNSIIILLPVKFLYCYGIMLAVLIRPASNILRNKVSQDLEFI